MSTNAFGDDKGVSGGNTGAAAQAPKLRNSAHYPAWKRDMEVWLERHGANGVHTRVIAPKEWKHYAEQVLKWGEEELSDAMQLFAPPSTDAVKSSPATPVLASSGSSVSTDSGSEPDADKMVKARKALTAMVHGSIRVYGIIFGTLQEELRNQAENNVTRGCA